MSDTLGIIVRSYRNYEYGNRQIPYDILAKFLYMRNELDDRKLAKILDEISNDNKIIALIDDDRYQIVVNEYLKYYQEYRISRTKEFAGITDTLLKLKKQGYKLFVISNIVFRFV